MPIFMSNIEGYVPRVKETIGVRNHRNSRCRETLYREGFSPVQYIGICFWKAAHSQSEIITLCSV